MLYLHFFAVLDARQKHAGMTIVGLLPHRHSRRPLAGIHKLRQMQDFILNKHNRGK